MNPIVFFTIAAALWLVVIGCIRLIDYQLRIHRETRDESATPAQRQQAHHQAHLDQLRLRYHRAHKAGAVAAADQLEAEIRDLVAAASDRD